MSEFSFSLLLIPTILFVLLTSDGAALIPLTSYGLLFSVFFVFSTYVESVKKWSSPKLTFSSSSQPVGVPQPTTLMQSREILMSTMNTNMTQILLLRKMKVVKNKLLQTMMTTSTGGSWSSTLLCNISSVSSSFI